MTHFKAPCAVVALGGNAISQPDSPDTVQDQYQHTRQSLNGLILLLRRGYNLAITHGNGPQVGAALRRVEMAEKVLPSVPLGMLVADSQGSIGYMIEQSLINRLARESIHRSVVTVITQVLVDEHDPAMSNPTKFIGRNFPHDEAEIKMKESGWQMRPYDTGEENWRRVVGSPIPLVIVNRKAIRELVQDGVVVIAAGGGGIPVYRDDNMCLEGVDAVIDKDRTAAILAHDIEAEELIILTNVDSVKLNFGGPNEQSLNKLRISEARAYLDEGQFPAGSMGPKVEAAIQFVSRGGERSTICALDNMEEAIDGESGTIILP